MQLLHVSPLLGGAWREGCLLGGAGLTVPPPVLLLEEAPGSRKPALKTHWPAVAPCFMLEQSREGLRAGWWQSSCPLSPRLSNLQSETSLRASVWNETAPWVPSRPSSTINTERNQLFSGFFLCRRAAGGGKLGTRSPRISQDKP